MVFAMMAFTLIAGVGSSSTAPAKEKLTANMQDVQYAVSDCL